MLSIQNKEKEADLIQYPRIIYNGKLKDILLVQHGEKINA